MTKVRSNVIVRGLSGKFAGQVVFRQRRDGQTVMAAIPDFSRRVLSKDQKAHHSKFKEGAAYAKYAAKHKPIYAELAAGTMKTAYNVALSDFFHAPKIQHVDWKDGTVRIQASDNVRVASVTVMILNEAGKAVEKGSAVQVNDAWWEYVPQETGRLQVEARDLAGNVTREEKGMENGG